MQNSQKRKILVQIEDLKKALNTDGNSETRDNNAIYVNLGELYLKIKDIENAIESFDQIPRFENNELFNLTRLRMSMYFIEVEDYERAINYLHEIDYENQNDKTLKALTLHALGLSYQKLNKLDTAEDYWKKISKDDSEERYAKAQYNIGILRFDEGNINEAINIWSKISRKDDLQSYVNSTLNLGNAYLKIGNKEQAINIWSRLRREDELDAYVESRFYIGQLLVELKRVDEALREWNKIKRSDDLENLYTLRFSQGLILANNGYLDLAIKKWKSIDKNLARNNYPLLQYNIAIAYFLMGELNNAIRHLKKIKRKDNLEIFLEAKLKLGNIYHSVGLNNEALHSFKQIQKSDNLQKYFEARNFIASIFLDKGNFKQSQKVLDEIIKNSNGENLAKAYFTKGLIYTDININNRNEAIKNWAKIDRELNEDIFILANFNIGVSYLELQDFSKAIEKFENLTPEDSSEIFVSSKYLTGVASFFLDDLIKARECFEITANENLYNYLSLIYLKLIDKKIPKSKKPYNLAQMIEVVKNIQQELFIDFKKLKGNNIPERKLAHYTTLSTFKLLVQEEDASFFRLNTINNVNDPSEGKVLLNYLEMHKSFNQNKFKDDYQAFISCFTFVHDSLNQFRLYGKTDGKEASGISIVFNKQFFSNDISSINNFLIEHELRRNKESDFIDSGKFNGKLKIFSKSLKSIILNKEPLQNKVESLNNKLPIYRCVYMDAKSGYIHLAQRNELTFYREACFGDNNNNKNLSNIQRDAEQEWGNYSYFINEKEKKVKYFFDKLKIIYDDLEQELKLEHKDIIDEIILPIRYLIKHSAFEEEQECRMIYLSKIQDKLVQMNFDNQQLFINYNQKVKDFIDKVYLGSEAKNYEPFVGKLLDIPDKVHISNNPFRNK